MEKQTSIADFKLAVVTLPKRRQVYKGFFQNQGGSTRKYKKLCMYTSCTLNKISTPYIWSKPYLRHVVYGYTYIKGKGLFKCLERNMA